MNNELAIGIMGLYTLVYVIVFIIQKSQIDKTKEINSSMKSFMDIFKIDEVKKYVDLKNERVMMQVDQILNEDEKIKDIYTAAINEKVEDLKEIYFSQMGEEHMELIAFVVEVLKSQTEEKRVELVEKGLPKTKRYFMKIIEDINNGEI